MGPSTLVVMGHCWVIPLLCSLGKEIIMVRKTANDPSLSLNPMFHISLFHCFPTSILVSEAAHVLHFVLMTHA